MKLIKCTLPGGDKYLRMGTDLNGWWPHAPSEVVDNRCGYNLQAGWGPISCGEIIPCSIHTRKCYCGEVATTGCSYAGGQFVCGTPVCAKHGWCDSHQGG